MDNNPASPLDTLRQLKEMLDAGALTPTEFEALKQRLVFTAPPAAPAPAASEPLVPAPTPPVIPASIVTPPVAAPFVPQAAPVPPPPAPFTPPASPPIYTPPAVPVERYPVVENVPLHFTLSGSDSTFPRVDEAKAADVPSVAPSRNFVAPPVASAPVLERDADANWVSNEFPESEAPAARSPLALILSIGGLLALLALVVYLSMNRPPSERLTSTSQTAADSVAATIEVGPQAEPLPQSMAVPETIRVVPTNPAPAMPPRPTAPLRDSATVAPASSPAPAPTASDSVPNP